MSMFTASPNYSSTDALIAAMENNYGRQGVLFGGWLPGVKFYLEVQDSLHYGTGFGDAWLNQVTWCDFAPDQIEKRVGDLTKQYSDLGVPSVWALRGSQPHREQLMVALETAGWRFVNDVPGMLCHLDAEPTSVANDFQIKRAESTQDVHDWLIPFSQGFGISPETIPFLHCMYSRAAANPHFGYYFVLYKNGVPLTSGSLMEAFGVWMIYNVATIPAARTQGAASAMVAHLKNQARLYGASQVGLFAEPAGQNIYRQQGFQQNGSRVINFAR